MRLLVTGAGGQLGHDVVRAAGAAGDDVHGLDPRRPRRHRPRRRARRSLARWRPDAVIHCAAWTAVDACEADPERAMTANGLAVRWVAEACDGIGAHLVHVSTDYVFDGRLPRPYHEWDRPNPLGVYGASKLAGEQRGTGARPGGGRRAHVVGVRRARTEHGADDPAPARRRRRQPGRLAFVDDQRGCPTFTADLAPMLLRLAAERRAGVHHVTNQGAVSWFQFAQAVAAAAGRDPAVVRPITTSELDPPRPAPRPANSVLDNAVLRAAGIPLLARLPRAPRRARRRPHIPLNPSSRRLCSDASDEAPAEERRAAAAWPGNAL